MSEDLSLVVTFSDRSMKYAAEYFLEEIEEANSRSNADNYVRGVRAGVKCGRLEWNSVCNWPNKVNVVNWSYVMTMRAIADFPQVLL